MGEILRRYFFLSLALNPFFFFFFVNLLTEIISIPQKDHKQLVQPGPDERGALGNWSLVRTLDSNHEWSSWRGSTVPVTLVHSLQ